jgi:hypothetical protein
MIPLEAFNGAPVNNLADLAAAVDANAEPFLNFQLEGGRWVTLDAGQVSAQGEEILRTNSIPRDRSEDLPPPSAAARAGAAGGDVAGGGAAGNGVAAAEAAAAAAAAGATAAAAPAVAAASAPKEAE